MSIVYRVLFFISVSMYLCNVQAQPAELEFEGVFGECEPVYEAVSETLVLYREPDLRSEQFELPYGNGWRIPAPKHKGITRVLTIGTLEVIKPDPDMHCLGPPDTGPGELTGGEHVEYLYYVGEGFGAIRFRGAQCEAAIIEDFGFFKTIRDADVQVWLRVFFADGSSPGWLFHDGLQTRVTKVLC